MPAHNTNSTPPSHRSLDSLLPTLPHNAESYPPPSSQRSTGAPEHFEFWRGKTSKGAHLSEVPGKGAKRPSGGGVGEFFYN